MEDPTCHLCQTLVQSYADLGTGKVITSKNCATPLEMKSQTVIFLCMPFSIHNNHKSALDLPPREFKKEESIPVGCVPPALVVPGMAYGPRGRVWFAGGNTVQSLAGATLLGGLHLRVCEIMGKAILV